MSEEHRLEPSRTRALLCLLGCPGSGKTTAGKWISRAYNFSYLDMGTLIRDHFSELPLQTQEMVRAGSLLDDDTCLAILVSRLESLKQTPGMVLAGFPRTKPQYERLVTTVSSKLSGTRIYFLILDLAPAAALHRLSKRREKGEKTGSVREDDQEQTVVRRLEVFEQETAPLIEAIGASQSISHVRYDSYCLKRPSLLAAVSPLLGLYPTPHCLAGRVKGD